MDESVPFPNLGTMCSPWRCWCRSCRSPLILLLGQPLNQNSKRRLSLGTPPIGGDLVKFGVEGSSKELGQISARPTTGCSHGIDWQRQQSAAPLDRPADHVIERNHFVDQSDSCGF